MKNLIFLYSGVAARGWCEDECSSVGYCGGEFCVDMVSHVCTEGMITCGFDRSACGISNWFYGEGYTYYCDGYTYSEGDCWSDSDCTNTFDKCVQISWDGYNYNTGCFHKDNCGTTFEYEGE